VGHDSKRLILSFYGLASNGQAVWSRGMGLENTSSSPVHAEFSFPMLRVVFPFYFSTNRQVPSATITLACQRTLGNYGLRFYPWLAQTPSRWESEAEFHDLKIKARGRESIKLQEKLSQNCRNLKLHSLCPTLPVTGSIIQPSEMGFEESRSYVNICRICVVEKRIQPVDIYRCI